MTTMLFEDFGRYSDVLRARSGEVVKVRFVEPGDAELLRAYVRAIARVALQALFRADP